MPEYRTWDAMIQRCTNPRHTAYVNYGQKGISVCNSWRLSYKAFLKDANSKTLARSIL